MLERLLIHINKWVDLCNKIQALDDHLIDEIQPKSNQLDQDLFDMQNDVSKLRQQQEEEIIKDINKLVSQI